MGWAGLVYSFPLDSIGFILRCRWFRDTFRCRCRYKLEVRDWRLSPGVDSSFNPQKQKKWGGGRREGRKTSWSEVPLYLKDLCHLGGNGLTPFGNRISHLRSGRESGPAASCDSMAGGSEERVS